MAPTKSNNDQDWLASLAHKSAASDVATRNNSSKQKKAHKKNDDKSIITSTSLLPTKAERIQHRQEKRQKREERKQKIEEERQARLAKKRGGQNQRDNAPSTSESGAKRSKDQTSQPAEKPLGRGMTPSSIKALVALSSTLASTISIHEKQSNHNKKRHTKTKSTDPPLINGLPPLPKGKATKSSTLTPHSTELQPRIRDYNGQGLARPSLFLPLNDPSFIPRLEEEFAEHIPGFFGIAKKRAGKKQKAEEEGMLWRKCLEEKRMSNVVGGGKKRKKRVVDMI